MDDLKKTIKTAALILEEGGVIGFPTETVYGLAARIDIPSAIEKIFTTKERPFFDPLIVHVHSVDQAKKIAAHWGLTVDVLAKVFWPGPLTMVLPKTSSVNPMITSGLESVGIRMPEHPVALDILRQVNVPLAAPSANKFGKTSPTKAEHVRNEFRSENVFVVDGGDCAVGIESTVLLVKEKSDITELAILRKGSVLQQDIEKVLNQTGLPFKFVERIDKKESPGHMKHHYMPSVPFILCKSEQKSLDEILAEVNSKIMQLPDEVESIKIVKPKSGIKSAQVLKMSSDPVLASREFYNLLRESANHGKDCIVFYKTQLHDGVRWEPLFDRLTKAASIVIE